MRAGFLAASAAAIVLPATGCMDTTDWEPSTLEEAALTPSQRVARAAQIRDAAAGESIAQGWLLAGIADAETQMAHCWSELTWACKGPSSPDCGGGPVVAGAGDGPCYLQEGGLGMFQFDAGTFSDTLAREGTRILSVAGNTQAAVDFVIDMVIRSDFIAEVSTPQQAIEWMNGVRPDNARFHPWIQTVTTYYNGCRPSFSCYPQRYAHYRDNARNVFNEMGAAFWDQASPVPADQLAIEVYWSRQASGSYELRALAPAEVESVIYRVDGHDIGAADRTDGHNFPTSYTFTSSYDERLFEVLGFDADGVQVGHGVGLLDVTDGVGVYIRQMGESLYEIGLERAPAGVAAIEVSAGIYTLTDAVSGAQRSTRRAVRSSFTQLGERKFEIRTYNADGSWRGTLRRTFTLL